LTSNIIFILLDACRADRFQGVKKKSITPTIDSLVKQGVYFEQTFSSTDYTMGSLGSILTSRYPLGAGETKEHYYKIHSGSTSFIEHFKHEGYHAYSTMHTSLAATGFSDDFENNDQEYLSNFPIYGPLGEKIIKKINSKTMKEPWIYFVHVLDLHGPVRLPEEFFDESYSQRYDRMIGLIDSWLSKIIEILDFENTLLVITSDHGDYIPVINTNTKESSTLVKQAKSIIKKFIPKSMHSIVHEKKFNLMRQAQAAKLQSKYEKRSLNLRPDRERYLYDEIIHVPLLFVGKGVPPKGKVSNVCEVVATQDNFAISEIHHESRLLPLALPNRG